MTISCKHFTKKYCEVCCSSKDNKLILKQNNVEAWKELSITIGGIK